MAQLVRRWTLKDLPVVQDVLWKTWLESYKPFIPEADLKSYFSEHYDLDALTTLFQNPMAHGFVAEVDGRVVGFMRTAHEPEENRYYVSSIYVLPDFQNRGLGRDLMKRAAEEAKSFKLDRVWIGVMVQNRQAVEWYEKMGYKVVRTEPFTMGASTVDHYIGYVLLESLERSHTMKP
ncbi:MAG: GNAT family N-acetyltransferase [Bacteroidota bacterium]